MENRTRLALDVVLQNNSLDVIKENSRLRETIKFYERQQEYLERGPFVLCTGCKLKKMEMDMCLCLSVSGSEEYSNITINCMFCSDCVCSEVGNQAGLSIDPSTQVVAAAALAPPVLPSEALVTRVSVPRLTPENIKNILLKFENDKLTVRTLSNFFSRNTRISIILSKLDFMDWAEQTIICASAI